jgi:dTDP-4-dehydrorhamnose reductase
MQKPAASPVHDARPALVVGASGLVGSHVYRELTAAGWETAGTFHNSPAAGLMPLDIESAAELERMLRSVRPSIVFWPASWTNVDGCETDPARSYRVNVAPLAHLARVANEVSATVVYFSSDYVFDGSAGPYGEDDIPGPLSIYGEHKLRAEHLVSTIADEWLILRTTVVFGQEPQGKNFVYRVVRTLGQQKTLAVPEDQLGSPTFAPDLARAAVRLAGEERGLFHVCGPRQMSRYDFAREAAERFGLDKNLIVPVATADLGQPARRPLRAGMRIEKLQSVAGIRMHEPEAALNSLRLTFQSEAATAAK